MPASGEVEVDDGTCAFVSAVVVGVGTYGYVGNMIGLIYGLYGVIGAAVDVEIGVVDAAGIGHTFGGRSEKQSFEELDFWAIIPTGPNPERAERDFAMPLADSNGVTTVPSTSFALAWLVSGREHLPGLVIDSDAGRADDFEINSAGVVGTGANSKELKNSSVSG